MSKYSGHTKGLTVGDRVWYRPHHLRHLPHPREGGESGTVVKITYDLIFVRFDGDITPKGCVPGQLQKL